MSAEYHPDGNDAQRALRVALAMARRELPPDDLAERLLSHVEYRALLARELACPRSSRAKTLLLGGLASALAAGAAAVLWPQHAAPSITPEAAPGGSHEAQADSRARAWLDPCSARQRAIGSAPVIDDFEDGDDAVLPLEGRGGLWRWVRETDARGTAPALLPVPRSGGTNDNQFALHVKGSRLFDWGATVEFRFTPPCYDASAYRGIVFEARGPGRVYVAPREVSVIPIEEGGECERDCHNPHAIKVDLDGNWRTYEVRWDDVFQRGIEKPPLDEQRLNSLAFLIRPEDTPYDVWFDDVRFLP